MSRVRRILIVEDDQSMNTILSDFLKKQGYAVTTATSANRALSILTTPLSPGKHPDLVLSDVKLGTMSGIEMTAQIAKEHPALPVILFSVFDQLEKEALASGARRFLKKPFSLEKLGEVVLETLNGKGKGITR